MLGLWGSGMGLVALTWLKAPQRGHLMTRSSASPVNSSLLHFAHLVGLCSIMRRIVVPVGSFLLG